MPEEPERSSRRKIDELLTAAGWTIQDTDDANVSAGRGVAIREFPLKRGHGFADYLLYVDGKAAGVERAFEGKLVPQDPNDEAASVLLERIRQERAAQAPGVERRPRRGRATNIMKAGA